LARSSSWVTSFPFHHDSLRVGKRDFNQVVTQLHQLIVPIYQHAIATFNACSCRSTHRPLTDTGGGYNLGGASFSHTTLRHSQPTVSTFHVKTSPDLRLPIQLLPQDLEREQTINLTSGRFHSTSTVSYHLSIACTNGNHQDDRVIKDKPEGRS
jgi:hypothetical protein